MNSYTRLVDEQLIECVNLLKLITKRFEASLKI